jgi:hypothetical protein
MPWMVATCQVNTIQPRMVEAEKQRAREATEAACGHARKSSRHAVGSRWSDIWQLFIICMQEDMVDIVCTEFLSPACTTYTYTSKPNWYTQVWATRSGKKQSGVRPFLLLCFYITCRTRRSSGIERVRTSSYALMQSNRSRLHSALHILFLFSCTFCTLFS